MPLVHPPTWTSTLSWVSLLLPALFLASAASIQVSQTLPPHGTARPVKGPHFDVVVVGAGLSGLVASYRLKQANGSLDILILDGMSHIGGRTWSMHLDKYNAKVSVGGTYSLFEHHDTLSLASELGRFPEDVVRPSDINTALSSPELIGFFSTPLGLPLFAELFYQGSLVFNGGDIQWNSTVAKKLDSQSLEMWIKEMWLVHNLNPDFTREFFYVLETYPDLSTVSALQCAISVYIRFAGILNNGFELPTTWRWEGGTGVFVDALVNRLRQLGSGRVEIITNSPVLRIAQPELSKDVQDKCPVEVIVHYNRSQTVAVRAEWVIVATSPTASAPTSYGGTIEYIPPLKEASARLFSSMVATPTVSLNILVVYQRPWWREFGGAVALVEYAHHVHGKGIYGNTVDATMNEEGAYGIVRIFCDSTRVQGWSQEQIKAGAIDYLKTLFPSAEQAALVDDFIDIIVWDWNQFKPTLPGVTYTFPPIGALSAYGHALREPHGRIMWAGSERSLWAAGWMEGAVERGNDVAQELLGITGWAPADYNVRKPRAKGAQIARPAAIPAGPSRQALLQGFVPRSRLDLAKRLSGGVSAQQDAVPATNHRISPKQWHDALVYLHDLMEGPTATLRTQ